MGLIVSMSTNALELTDMSLGIKHVGVPSGIATSANDVTHDNSDKYRQGYRTVNLTFDQVISRTEDNLVGVSAMISSGYRSEALTIRPYISPRFYWVTRLTSDLTFQISAELPTLGGSISEKKWIDKHGFDFSYATARPWSEWEDFGGIQLQAPDTITLRLVWRF